MKSAGLRLRPLGIDTHQEFVIYMRRDCHVCRAEGFEAQTRVEVTLRDRQIIAKINVVGLRPHYALTLRHWVQRLEANREAALREVDEPTYRVWRLYMAACTLEFESGGTGIYQVLASRRNRGEWPVPLSRRDLYADRDDGRFAGMN